MISEKLKAFLIKFTFPHECVFLPGHYGDLDFVTSENVSGDKGGITKWGIDQASHPNLIIEKLTMADAMLVYQQRYWDHCRCEELAEPLCYVVFDIAVNNGAARAILWLQQACGVAVDGRIGPVTLAAANANPREIASELIAARGEHYREWAEVPSQKKFLHGWLNRNADLQEAIAA